MKSAAKKDGANPSTPGKIHLRIIEVMKRFPDGVSGGQIRQELEKEGLKPEDQTHLDRRKRDLKKWFVIRKKPSSLIVDGKKRNVMLYQFGGDLKAVTDEGQVSTKVRAEVIHSAHGRCQMCGGMLARCGVVRFLRILLRGPRLVPNQHVITPNTARRRLVPERCQLPIEWRLPQLSKA
jgi:hypothetical protein